MTTSFTRFVQAGIIVGLIFLTLLVITQKSYGSAPSGLPATIATTTVQTVGTTARLLIATSTCAARIITTRAQPIMLTFSDYNGALPTATFGHLQPASTTVVYDSGQWGCNAVEVYAFGTDTITVTESR